MLLMVLCSSASQQLHVHRSSSHHDRQRLPAPTAAASHHDRPPTRRPPTWRGWRPAGGLCGGAGLNTECSGAGREATWQRQLHTTCRAAETTAHRPTANQRQRSASTTAQLVYHDRHTSCMEVAAPPGRQHSCTALSALGRGHTASNRLVAGRAGCCMTTHGRLVIRSSTGAFTAVIFVWRYTPPRPCFHCLCASNC